MFSTKKAINTTAFTLQSSRHDAEVAATFSKVYDKGLATWSYPQSS